MLVCDLRKELGVGLAAGRSLGVYEGDDRPPPAEYERLVGPVLGKLHSGDSADSIAAYLTRDVRTNMGVPSRPEADLETAKRLHAWFHDRPR